MCPLEGGRERLLAPFSPLLKFTTLDDRVSLLPDEVARLALARRG